MQAGEWTARTLHVWIFYGIVAVVVLSTELSFHWISAFLASDLSHIISTYFFLLMFCVEPIALLFSTLTIGRYPEELSNSPETAAARISKNSEACVVIPCHNSQDIIAATINACLNHFNENQIFVVDNGNSPGPTDQTKQVLHGLAPSAHYIWNPVGNKTLACYAGAQAAWMYKYVLVIDDDVALPEKFDLSTHLIQGNSKAVMYPLLPVDSEGCCRTFLMAWQRLEYQMSDYIKLGQDKFASVSYPHGAACLWDRTILVKALRGHDTVFYAEDAKLGMWLRTKGYDLRMAPLSLVDTLAPETIFGPMPNFFSQRTLSWEMAEHLYFFRYLKMFFTTSTSTFSGTVYIKFSELYILTSIMIDWVRVPAVLMGLTSPTLYIIIAGYIGVSFLVLPIWNIHAYWNRPDLKLPVSAMLTFFVYRFLVHIIRFLSIVKAFFFFIPTFQPKPTIPTIEKAFASQEESTKVVDFDQGLASAFGLSEGSVNVSDNELSCIWLHDKSKFGVIRTPSTLMSNEEYQYDVEVSYPSGDEKIGSSKRVVRFPLFKTDQANTAIEAVNIPIENLASGTKDNEVDLVHDNYGNGFEIINKGSPTGVNASGAITARRASKIRSKIDPFILSLKSMEEAHQKSILKLREELEEIVSDPEFKIVRSTVPTDGKYQPPSLELV